MESRFEKYGETKSKKKAGIRFRHMKVGKADISQPEAIPKTGNFAAFCSLSLEFASFDWNHPAKNGNFAAFCSISLEFVSIWQHFQIKTMKNIQEFYKILVGPKKNEPFTWMNLGVEKTLGSHWWFIQV